MKERILQWLEAFTREDYLQNNELKAIQSYLETQGIKLTIEDLHYRSKSFGLHPASLFYFKHWDDRQI